MFREPDRIEPQFLSILNLFHRFLEDATLVRRVCLRPGRENKQPKFHTMMSSSHGGVAQISALSKHMVAMNAQSTPPPAANRGRTDNAWPSPMASCHMQRPGA